MATYLDYNPSKYNDFITPNYIWDYLINNKEIFNKIKDKRIWEAFYCNGESGNYLKSQGLNIILENIDFFKNNKGDIVISNPPFENKKEVINRLIELQKPFILIVPVSTINYQYTRQLKDIQILIPPKRMKFIKYNKKDKTIDKDWIKKSTAFDSIFLCWKMDLSKDIIFI